MCAGERGERSLLFIIMCTFVRQRVRNARIQQIVGLLWLAAGLEKSGTRMGGVVWVVFLCVRCALVFQGWRTPNEHTKSRKLYQSRVDEEKHPVDPHTTAGAGEQMFVRPE